MTHLTCNFARRKQETVVSETLVSEIRRNNRCINHFNYEILWKKRWDEIDIIAADEIEQTVCFYEVKRQAEDVVIGIVKEKAEHFFLTTGRFKKYNIEYKGLSMEDM